MDLSEFYFYGDDKKDVCEFIESEKISIRKFASDHKLKKSTIGKWMKQWKVLKSTGRDTFGEECGGRPPKLDSHSSAELCRYLKQARSEQNAATSAQLNQKIKDEVMATSARRGIANDPGHIAAKTLFNIKVSHDCEEGKCQLKTRARIINEADPRNAYTMACMMYAFCAILAACMVFNWDATQFYINLDVNDKAVYIKSDENQRPLTRESSGTLGISIKYYHFHNAAGETAPAVYIIADDKMAEEDFVVLPIIGLGNSTEVGSKG
jgi:transposase